MKNKRDIKEFEKAVDKILLSKPKNKAVYENEAPTSKE